MPECRPGIRTPSVLEAKYLNTALLARRVTQLSSGQVFFCASGRQCLASTVSGTRVRDDQEPGCARMSQVRLRFYPARSRAKDATTLVTAAQPMLAHLPSARGQTDTSGVHRAVHLLTPVLVLSSVSGPPVQKNHCQSSPPFRIPHTHPHTPPSPPTSPSLSPPPSPSDPSQHPIRPPTHPSTHSLTPPHIDPPDPTSKASTLLVPTATTELDRYPNDSTINDPPTRTVDLLL